MSSSVGDPFWTIKLILHLVRLVRCHIYIRLQGGKRRFPPVLATAETKATYLLYFAPKRGRAPHAHQPVTHGCFERSRKGVELSLAAGPTLIGALLKTSLTCLAIATRFLLDGSCLVACDPREATQSIL